MIDQHTVQTTKIRRRDGKKLSLVMSDEFKEEGRDFGPGKDDKFEAITQPDDTNESIQFCKQSHLHTRLRHRCFSLVPVSLDNASTEYVTTKDDCLVITTKAVKTTYVGVDPNNNYRYPGTANAAC